LKKAYSPEKSNESPAIQSISLIFFSIHHSQRAERLLSCVSLQAVDYDLLFSISFPTLQYSITHKQRDKFFVKIKGFNRKKSKMPYSVDLRERAVQAVHEGLKKITVCKIFNIARQTLYSWLSLKKRQGHLMPQTGFQKGHSHAIHAIKDLAGFRKFVARHGDSTQEEMAEIYKVGSSIIGRALKKIGYSRKKRVPLMLKEAKKNE
jgi:transposase